MNLASYKEPLTVPVAFVLWYFTFQASALDFWARITASTFILLALSLVLGRKRMGHRPTVAGIAVGLASALLLYLFFWSGYQVLKGYPAFAGQISSVYTLRSTVPAYLVASLLLFPIGPTEEVYWRGLIQGYLGRRLSARGAIASTAVLYSLIHLPTMNPPLMFVALVGGLAWGYVFQRFGLAAAITSHVLFDEMIFVFFVIS